MMSVTISKTTKTYPHHPYTKICSDVLGKEYLLSLVFIGVKKAKKFNLKFREKDYVPDVLSFPLDKTCGEIYMCLPKIKSTHKMYNRSFQQQVVFLFIHSLLHLKGYEHGEEMEFLEAKFAKKYMYDV